MATRTTKKIISIAAVSLFSLFFFGSWVFASGIPQVQTNAATNIQDTSATLSANTYDLGGDYSASVWFQYGTTSGYGYETTRMNQNYTGYFSQNVYGLGPNTVYHYRAVVQNGYSVNYGQDMVFTTSSSSFSFYAQTNAATNVYNNQATLNGYVYGGTYSAIAWFQYGTTSSYGYVTNSQQLNYSGSVSQNITNLVAGTTYHYRILTQSSSGQMAYGQDMTFYTGGYTTPYCQSNQASILEGIRQIIVLLQQILANLR